MKNLAYVLTVLVVLSLVIGCGGEETTATPEPSATPKSTSIPTSQDGLRVQGFKGPRGQVITDRKS